MRSARVIESSLSQPRIAPANPCAKSIAMTRWLLAGTLGGADRVITAMLRSMKQRTSVS